MSAGFLERAARAARENIVNWKKTYGPLREKSGRERPEFLKGSINGCGVIAEIKMKSPSRGNLMKGSDPLSLAGTYTGSGAEAISVVVEEKYFEGSPGLFERVRSRTDLPLLWKDFVVDPYQIRLASHLGASAVLLIGSLVFQEELRALIQESRANGLKPLVEVHNGKDLEGALEAGADLVGVNNRDLVSLEVNTDVSRRLASLLPPDLPAVSESGIRGADDIRFMAGLGYRAVLVGEALVTAREPGILLEEMVEAGKET